MSVGWHDCTLPALTGYRKPSMMGKHLNTLKTVFSKSKDLSVWKPLWHMDIPLFHAGVYAREVLCSISHPGFPSSAEHCSLPPAFSRSWPGLLSLGSSNLLLLRLVDTLAGSAGASWKCRPSGPPQTQDLHFNKVPQVFLYRLCLRRIFQQVYSFSHRITEQENLWAKKGF